MTSPPSPPHFSSSHPTSIPTHRPLQRQGSAASLSSSTSSSSSGSASRRLLPTYRRGQPYLNLQDLHTRFSPSPPPRMPRVQRSLSMDDLHQRFRSRLKPGNEEMQAQRLPTGSQRSPLVSASISTAPPLAIRPTKQSLSVKLPDPPVFNGDLKQPALFDDWKLRIIDKLTHNSDHFPTESFKIAYVISRLEGETIKHTSPRRRRRPYETVNELLDHMTDIYETPLSIIDLQDSRDLKKLRQEKSFQEFYAEFSRCSDHRYSDGHMDKRLVYDFKDGLANRLRRAVTDTGKDWASGSLSELKKFVINFDYIHRWNTEERTERKAQAYAAQYKKAEKEAIMHSAISILTRPRRRDEEDPATFRR